MRKLLLSVLFLAACGDNFNYETRHGIFVRLGEINRPDKELVELWTDETFEFWYDAMGWESCIDIYSTIVIFADDVVLTTVDGRKTWAYCDLFRKVLTIGLGSEDKEKREHIVRSAFKHELSHLVAYTCGGFADEEESHQFFRDMGTGF